MLSPKIIRIGLDHGTPYCIPWKGHCFAHPGETISWEFKGDVTGDLQFWLTFTWVPFGGEPVPDWPFVAPPPAPPSSTGWVSTFPGTISGLEEVVYEYTVKVRDSSTAPPVIYTLDPIIIVGK